MTAFIDGVTAYTVAQIGGDSGWVVVVINSEEQGYHTMGNLRTVHVTEEEAQMVATALNHRMGIYEDEELAVKTCSMFPGARYEDELQKFRDKRVRGGDR